MEIVKTKYRLTYANDIYLPEDAGDEAGNIIRLEGEKAELLDMQYYQLQKDGEIILRATVNKQKYFFSVFMTDISKIEKIDTILKTEVIFDKDI